MADIIQIRRDTEANWKAANPILAQGEPALEIDSKKEKIGDGVTAWNALGYRNAGSGPPTSMRIIPHPDNDGLSVKLKDVVEIYLKVGANEYLCMLRYMNLLADNDTANYGSEPSFDDGNYNPISIINLNE